MSLLNIGCGNCFHREWVNIDVKSNNPNVIEHNILKGLPFSDKKFDAVYSSHLLENIDPEQGLAFLREVFRVLKKGGIARIVVPDLETIARLYLEKLDISTKGDKSALHDYNWIKLELLDQVARSRPGGMMLRYLIDPEIANRDFVLSRIGKEAQQFWNTSSGCSETPTRNKFIIQKLRLMVAKVFVRIIAGSDSLTAFEEGLFRNSGEVHRWMYDRFSLKRQMEKSGFTDVKKCTAYESGIAGFPGFNLDVAEGKVRKPDSLFMEGVKRK